MKGFSGFYFALWCLPLPPSTYAIYKEVIWPKEIFPKLKLFELLLPKI